MKKSPRENETSIATVNELDQTFRRVFLKHAAVEIATGVSVTLLNPSCAQAVDKKQVEL